MNTAWWAAIGGTLLTILIVCALHFWGGGSDADDYTGGFGDGR